MSNTRLAVTVSEQDSEYIEGIVRSGKFTTRSDYIRHLVRQDKQQTIAKLEALLEEGYNSGVSEQPAEEFFSELRKEVAKVSK